MSQPTSDMANEGRRLFFRSGILSDLEREQKHSGFALASFWSELNRKMLKRVSCMAASALKWCHFSGTVTTDFTLNATSMTVMFCLNAFWTHLWKPLAVLERLTWQLYTCFCVFNRLERPAFSQRKPCSNKHPHDCKQDTEVLPATAGSLCCFCKVGSGDL